MIDRRLILCREGAPIAWGLFANDVRQAILALPDCQADTLQVWHVPSWLAGTPGVDVTKRFAMSWARETEFGEGIDPRDYLAPFPAFVLEHCSTELMARWLADMPPIDLPNPIRRVA